MKKYLYITHLSGPRVNRIWLSALIAAKELGYEVHLACNMKGIEPDGWEQDCRKYGLITHHIDFDRNPIGMSNYKAYKQLRTLIAEENFDTVHCNTPIGGVLGRICCHFLKTSHVIYQAHGFHFWKGAPILNWLIYYPVEKFLSRWTDTLLTINEEDYFHALKFHAKRVCNVSGVGIDTEAFSISEELRQLKRKSIREELSISADATVLLSVGELIPRKNHKIVIEALARINVENIYYVICGRGPLKESYEEFARHLKVDKRVILAGFRYDIADFYSASDIFVFPSLQEGLPVALMEAMGSGVPVVCSEIRGNIDLVDDGVTGYYIKNDASDVESQIKYMVNHPEKSLACAQAAKKKIQIFGLDNVIEQLKSVYENK